MNGRNINNLQGLLRFALQYTKSEDAPNESTFRELDPERREFLENVFKSMTVDVIEEFRKAIEILESQNSKAEEKVEALGTISEYVDNIDFANNFIKIGGSKIIIACLDSENLEIKSTAANLIAELTQNNPFCQKHFTEQNILKKLIELLSDEEKVSSSALYAISCLVRHYEDALAAFIRINGIECILKCLSNDKPKLFVKACFLLNALSTEFEIVQDEFLKHGAFEKLQEFVVIPEKYDVRLETVLSTLVTLSSSKNCKSIILSEELHTKLQNIVEKFEDSEEFQEIVGYSKSLLDKFPPKKENIDK